VSAEKYTTQSQHATTGTILGMYIINIAVDSFLYCLFHQLTELRALFLPNYPSTLPPTFHVIISSRLQDLSFSRDQSPIIDSITMSSSHKGVRHQIPSQQSARIHLANGRIHLRIKER
jgi:hypothetical protein